MRQILFFSILLTQAVSCLADIRPRALVAHSPSAAEAKHGRELLSGVVKRWGGSDHWSSAGAMVAELGDHWPAGPARMMAMPWPQSGQPVRLSWQIGTDNARLEFSGGERAGEIWGIQNWATYTIKDGVLKFKDDKTITFWLPTIQYFIEAPFRLGSADVLFYAGEGKARGQEYDLVFVSWGTAEPQSSIDQYLLWINRATGQLDFMQYTVRDMYPFVTGVMHYQDFRPIGSLTLPHRLTAAKGLETDGYVHEMRIASIGLAPITDPRVFVPEPLRAGKK
ncbi:MAG: hypothetical protein JNM27_02720 [Leptospirales bacterium]|nr:hypothetical protein [Leptospirales bacterium]